MGIHKSIWGVGGSAAPDSLSQALDARFEQKSITGITRSGDLLSQVDYAGGEMITVNRDGNDAISSIVYTDGEGSILGTLTVSRDGNGNITGTTWS